MADAFEKTKWVLQVQGSDEEESDLLSRQLYHDLQDLDVLTVEPYRQGSAPPGTKGLEAAVVGTLLVEVMLKSVPNLLDFLHSWTSRGEKRNLSVSVEKDGKKVTVEFSPRTTSTAELKKMFDTLFESPNK